MIIIEILALLLIVPVIIGVVKVVSAFIKIKEKHLPNKNKEKNFTVFNSTVEPPQSSRQPLIYREPKFSESENTKRRRAPKQQLVNKKQPIKKENKKQEVIDIHTGREFEHFMGMYFKRIGAKNVIVSPATNDGGKDIVFNLDKEKYIVECKKYSSNKIGRPQIQQFHSAIINENANCGIYITTSFFSRSAVEYANKHNILLWDRPFLIKKLKEAKIQLSITY